MRRDRGEARRGVQAAGCGVPLPRMGQAGSSGPWWGKLSLVGLGSPVSNLVQELSRSGVRVWGARRGHSHSDSCRRSGSSWDRTELTFPAGAGHPGRAWGQGDGGAEAGGLGGTEGRAHRARPSWRGPHS